MKTSGCDDKAPPNYKGFWRHSSFVPQRIPIVISDHSKDRVDHVLKKSVLKFKGLTGIRRVLLHRIYCYYYSAESLCVLACKYCKNIRFINEFLV